MYHLPNSTSFKSQAPASAEVEQNDADPAASGVGTVHSQAAEALGTVHEPPISAATASLEEYVASLEARPQLVAISSTPTWAIPSQNVSSTDEKNQLILTSTEIVERMTTLSQFTAPNDERAPWIEAQLKSLLDDILTIKKEGVSFSSEKIISLLNSLFKMEQYNTISDILVVLLPDIAREISDKNYFLPSETVQRLIAFPAPQIGWGALCTLLPQIRFSREKENGRELIPLDLMPNVISDLKAVAYHRKKHWTQVNDVARELGLQITNLKKAEQHLNITQLGEILKNLHGLANPHEYEELNKLLLEFYTSVVYISAKRPLLHNSLAQILYSLVGKDLSNKDLKQKIENLLSNIYFLTIDKLKTPLTMHETFQAVEGLSALPRIPRASELLSNILSKKITPETLNKNNITQLPVHIRSLIYSLALYKHRGGESVGTIITAGEEFMEKLIPELNKLQDLKPEHIHILKTSLTIVKGGFAILKATLPATVNQQILQYLAKIHGYDIDKDSCSLNLHDCSFILANALCEYVLESFLSFSDIMPLTLIFGFSSHNNANKGIMRNIVVDNLATYSYALQWPEDNQGMVIISGRDNVNTNPTIVLAAEVEPRPIIGPTLRPSYGPEPRTVTGTAPRSSYGPEPRPIIGTAPRPSYGPEPRPIIGPTSRPSYGPEPRTIIEPVYEWESISMTESTPSYVLKPAPSEKITEAEEVLVSHTFFSEPTPKKPKLKEPEEESEK